MIIRDARKDDVPELATRCAHQELLRRYGTTAEKLSGFLTRAIERGDPLLVVEDDGKAVGFAWFHPSGTFANGGYLRLIALEPGREGRGLGAALLDEMEKRVAALSEHMFLLCSDFNTAARRFYKARGYQEVGSLQGFVLPDVAEIICWKKLR
jgi:ribosomal protein S18 acetylase RimI-like enzyme